MQFNANQFAAILAQAKAKAANSPKWTRAIEPQEVAPYRSPYLREVHVSFNSEGLKRLRQTLKDISFRLHKLSFKVDIQGDAVWIRAMKANAGTQETTHSVRAKLSLLDDAVKME